MSQRSTNSSEQSTHITDIQMSHDEQHEFQNLPGLLTQWKRIQEEKHKLLEQKRVLLEQISEHTKRCSVMEGLIMGTMKKHSIGALDLKSSNARVLYKKSVRKSPISKKQVVNLMAEHLKSETAAKELHAYLETKRETKTKETLKYEKNEVVE